MPGPQDHQSSEPMPELPDEVFGDQEGLSRAGSPDWGGVDLSLGDNADATGGPPTDDEGEVTG